MSCLNFTHRLFVSKLRHDCRAVRLVLTSAWLLAVGANAQAANSLRGGAMSGAQNNKTPASTSGTSQTSTPATDTTSQNVATGAAAQHAQTSLNRSIQALQAMQATQAAARSAAAGATNLGLGPINGGLNLPTVTDGLGGNGLTPAGGAIVSRQLSKIQIIKLGNTGNTINLASGGRIAVPKGTKGSDTVSVTGAGTVTSTGGTTTAHAGTVTTSAGGTLSTVAGGTVTLAAGSSTLSVVTDTNITSSAAVTITLPHNAGTVTIPAGQAQIVPAGSKISYTGSGSDTVTIASSGAASTVTLNGAGTLALNNTGATGNGGTITTNVGTVSFTNGASSTLPAGSTINLAGPGTVSFTGAANDSLSVLLQTTPTASAPATNNFTTTGTILNTVDYVVPSTGQYAWKNVGGLSQSVDSTNNHITDTVTQTGQQALLFWDSFNIGRNTTLSFDQSAGGANVGQWVSINQLTNASLKPSQILGAIEAPGQVYVINQNGIIFGGESQVNVHALVASSLQINQNLVNNGLINNSTDLSYLFSSVQDANGNLLFAPKSTPTTLTGGNTNISTGGVIVAAGAQITAEATSNHGGGKVALIGPSVENLGTINTPDGQTILAAGLQVGLSAHNSNDPTLRGLDVYVGAAQDRTGYDQSSWVTDGYGPASGVVSNGLALNQQGTLPAGAGSMLGLIEAPRASITLAGMNVQQNGFIDSSTSVAFNGRVDLLADYGAILTKNRNNQLQISATSTGSVSLGAGSVTQILPELNSTDTVVGSKLALSSLVNMQGASIEFQQNALLWAPSAALPSSGSAVDFAGNILTAGVTLNSGTWFIPPLGRPTTFFSTIDPNSPQQILMDSGASIDVSGSADVTASVTEDIVTAQLRGAELANSPLQRDGSLRGKTIEFSLLNAGVNADGSTWIGTPLGDVSGYANLVQHTVGELTTNGGTIAVKAGSAVNMANDASVNVSGGWINYQGANVTTTKVMSGGQIVDISQASPNLLYSKIYSGYNATSAKWNVSQNFINSLVDGTTYMPGYTQGGNAGGLSITAPAMTLTGNLYGNTVAGIHQQTLGSQLSSTYAGANFLPTVLATQAIPTAGSLSLNFQTTVLTTGVTYSPTPYDVVFQPGQGHVANPMSASGNPELDLSSDLINVNGFANFSIDNSNNAFNAGSTDAVGAGNIIVPVGVTLNAQAGGNLQFSASNIEVDGSINAPSGSISLTAVNKSSLAHVLEINSASFPADPTRGNFTLGADASLSTAGNVSKAQGQLPQPIDGGSIAIDSYNANLAQGSTINVSGGAYLNSAGTAIFGNAGSLSIKAGRADSTIYTPEQGNLFLGSTLSGYSGGLKGGSLTIQAPLIQVGGSTLQNGDGGVVSQEGSLLAGTGKTLWIDKDGSGDFFSSGGFSSFNLTGLGSVDPDHVGQYLPGVVIASGANIAPKVQRWVWSTDKAGLDVSTFPLSSQRAPVSLAFNSPGLKDNTGVIAVRGQVVDQAGSHITIDPNAGNSVTLSGQTVAVLGSIQVHGGQITISAGNSNDLFGQGQAVLPTVDLASTAVLDVSGATQLTANAFGYKTGNVLNGGKITVSGNILAEDGAVLNVSGSTDRLQVPTQASNGLSQVSSTVFSKIDSSGGTISLNGTQLLVSDAVLLGKAGGSSAQAGTLIVTNGSTFLDSTTAAPQSTLVILEDGTTIDTSLGLPGLGVAVNPTRPGTTNLGNPIYGYITASSIEAGGFDNVTLGGGSGGVTFAGDVSLSAGRSLTIARGGVIYADGAVTLQAPYISLGQAFQAPLSQLQQSQVLSGFKSGSDPEYFLPTNGTGTLDIKATTLVDIGTLSLQGIGQVNIDLSNPAAGSMGDIRGNGTFDVNGSLIMTAAQIYPTTENIFTIANYASDGLILIQHGTSALPSLPYSAGGTLNIYASSIIQDGVLRAPLGTINLGSGIITGQKPIDLITGVGIAGSGAGTIPSTQNITLTSESVTSVSAINKDGTPLIIPYGINVNGTQWIDPSGTDITVLGNAPGGVPAKAVTISGVNVTDSPGATIDISGGGDLYAYRFVTGLGGTNDTLNTLNSFAVMPSYSAAYAPYAPYNANVSATDPGYVNSNLKVGDQIYLNGSNGLPAGYYTLLPARYALLPGAFLVTPKSSVLPGATQTQVDGSSLVSGYRTNGLRQSTAPTYTTFEVDSGSVVRSRSEYDDSFASTYFSDAAKANNLPIPRLPTDAGQLIFAAGAALTYDGTLLAKPGKGGLGGIVDISSNADILITGDPAADSSFQGLVLSTDQLNSIGAASLLIGGYTTSISTGTQVTVATNSLEVKTQDPNSTDPSPALVANDLILVSKGQLNIDAGTTIETPQSTVGSAPTLNLSGDGALLRVSSSQTAQTFRTNVNPANTSALLTIGDNVTIQGIDAKGQPAPAGSAPLAVGSLTLDSSSGINISSNAGVAPILSAETLSFSGGLISVVFNDATTQPTQGLVLTDTEIQGLQQSAKNMSFQSYSSFDIYGDGTLGTDATGKTVIQNFAVHAAGINGFGVPANAASGVVIKALNNIILDNSPKGTMVDQSGAPAAGTSLMLMAPTVQFGGGLNGFKIQGYESTNVVASSAIAFKGMGWTTANNVVTAGGVGLSVAGDLNLNAPIIRGTALTSAEAAADGTGLSNIAANQTITAGGNLTILSNTTPAGTTTPESLGSTLNFVGNAITDNGNIVLPSGSVQMHATGDVVIGNTAQTLIDVGGTAKTFNDLVQYTNGGLITVSSANGNVILGTAKLNVAANTAGGSAGMLELDAANGQIVLDPAQTVLLGQAGTKGQTGSVKIDVGNLGATNDLAQLEAALASGSFNNAQTIRVRGLNGINDVVINSGTTIKAHTFTLSADQGSITVAGTVDASGKNASLTGTGGAINLYAANDVTLTGTLDASADTNDSAGKGGAIGISTTNGQITLAANSKIDLSVTHPKGDASLGDFSGTLHLRAPQIVDGSGNPVGVAINPIQGQITGASQVLVEGYRVFVPSDGTTIDLTEGDIAANGAAFVGLTNSIVSNLTSNAALANLIVVEPGAEIHSGIPGGDLFLQSTWDLAQNDGLGNYTYRFGNNLVPGILTIRADGNIILPANGVNGPVSLTDGFDQNQSIGFASALWGAPLMQAGMRSWSYNLVAGADVTAANTLQVLVQDTSNADAGSVELGQGSPSLPQGEQTDASSIIPSFYQTIRTGTGDINIAARGSVQILNPLATIYTAGTKVADATNGGAFDVPVIGQPGGNGNPGYYSPPYQPQYSLAGGNVSIQAQNDIAHLLMNDDGTLLIDDSSKEMPTNWLYRQGYVDGQGNFAVNPANIDNFGVSSTSWWIDFSNFFEGVGALGGGNVTLIAGHDVRNVDAVIPTNARMPKASTSASDLIELGGGDLIVQAGHDISGGVYYVEKGNGAISAGNDIRTNKTRAAVLQTNVATSDPTTWLPTTLFAGKSSFQVSAGNDLTLGPVANPFLLPQGINNDYQNKTYFTTYAANDRVDVAALSGDVTLKNDSAGGAGSLVNWYNNVLFSNGVGTNNPTFAETQPWLGLAETNIIGSAGDFTTLTAIMPPTLTAIAYSGDINLAGTLILFPSPTGTVDLLSAGAINGFQANGSGKLLGRNFKTWASSVINLSDADPASIPGVGNPLSAANSTVQPEKTSSDLLAGISVHFQETGSTQGAVATLQAKQALHDAQLLHAGDLNPVHIYAGTGDISGLTLFSSKVTKVVAGRDLTDIALYIQNNNTADISVAEAGRDIIAYDPNSTLRGLLPTGDQFAFQTSSSPLGTGVGGPTSGDIQISGPGTLEVLAGGNLTLGIGGGRTDGTGAGIVSIGQNRNPALPVGGASIIAAAGIGSGYDLANGHADFPGFIDQFLAPGSTQSSRYLPDLGVLLGMSGSSNADIWAAFDALSKQNPSLADTYALTIFYDVLRDAGRDHNSGENASYSNAYSAIEALFPTNGFNWKGDVTVTSREIKTESGGDISILTPGGQVTVGLPVAGTQAVDQGILTVDGGNISIFAKNNVNVGTSRIFTLHGGNEILWSTVGNIAAGASSKTVQSAPPTRVLVDPQSGDVQTDLAGLATGGGIGVLQSVPGAPPGDVDLIAPSGTVDAGDAGIRASGNLNIAAQQVLNASNISVGGKSSGVPSAQTPNIAGIAAASNAGGSANQAATNSSANQQQANQTSLTDVPSIITVEILGYGGDEND